MNLNQINGLAASHSDNIPFESIKEFDEYAKNLYIVCFKDEKLALTEDAWDKLSATDAVELWAMYGMILKKSDPKVQEEGMKLINRLAGIFIEKVLKLNKIFCLFNINTNEPQMYTHVEKKEKGYYCPPVDIWIFTEAIVGIMDNSDKDLEVREILNGEGGNGIRNFLSDAFYLNGAQGVRINNRPHISIGADILVPPPDWSNIPAINVPVTNPEVMRWALLLAQIRNDDSEDENVKLCWNIYWQAFAQSILNAKFLSPIKVKGEGQNGEFKKDDTITFINLPGKNGRDAIPLYTDWKRMRQRYPDWSGSITTIEREINSLDVVINLTPARSIGFFIDADMYKSMKGQGSDVEAKGKSQQPIVSEVTTETTIPSSGEKDKYADTLDIIKVIDNTTARIRVYKKKASEDEKYNQVVQSFEKTKTSLQNILKKQGVESYRNPGHDVDLSKQEIIGIMATEDKAKDGRVASRINDGYRRGEDILRPEKIKIYSYHRNVEVIVSEYMLQVKLSPKRTIENMDKMKRHEDIMTEFCCYVLSGKYPKEGLSVEGHTAKELQTNYPLSPLGAYNYLIYLREKPEEALENLKKGLPRK